MPLASPSKVTGSPVEMTLPFGPTRVGCKLQLVVSRHDVQCSRDASHRPEAAFVGEDDSVLLLGLGLHTRNDSESDEDGGEESVEEHIGVMLLLDAGRSRGEQVAEELAQTQHAYIVLRRIFDRQFGSLGILDVDIRGEAYYLTLY